MHPAVFRVSMAQPTKNRPFLTNIEDIRGRYRETVQNECRFLGFRVIFKQLHFVLNKQPVFQISRARLNQHVHQVHTVRYVVQRVPET